MKINPIRTKEPARTDKCIFSQKLHYQAGLLHFSSTNLHQSNGKRHSQLFMEITPQTELASDRYLDSSFSYQQVSKALRVAAPCLLAATSNVQTFCLHSQLEKSICYEFSPMSNLCLKITQIKCKTKNDGSLEAYYWMQTFTVSHCKGKKKNENQTNHRVTWENTGHCDSGLKF